MRVRALTALGDWTYGAGLNDYLTSNAAVAQAIGTRLSSFLGDCFFATQAGIDWFNFLGGKDQISLQLAISATILNTSSQGQPVVTGIVNLSLNLDDTTRVFTVTYEATSIYGNVQGVVNQNLGIGLMPPPVNNLLPQQNQSLFNNVGATIINNAIFSSTAFWGVDLQYFVERRTSTQGFVQRGVMVLKFDPKTSTWGLVDNVMAGSSGPTTGVIFTIDPSTGQVYYASDNVTGSNYIGNLIVQSLETFTAGL
jgi:hypothetical protein